MIAQAIGKPIPVEGFKKVKKQFILDFPFKIQSCSCTTTV